MRTALHLVLAGDPSAAEAALAEAARLDPDSTDVYMALSNLYRARGDIGRAIQIHQNVLLRHDLPEDLRREALLGLALDFRSGGFLKRAASSFEELLEVEPHNLQALRELERIRVESGDWEGAIRIRRRIGSRDPRTARILAHLWAGRAGEQVRAGDSGAARKSLKRALGYDRTCAEVFLALGDLALEAGKPRKATSHWERALPLHPAIGMLVYPKLREAFGRERDLPAFESLLLTRLAAQPEDREAALWLARVQLEQGRSVDAVATLRQILERMPSFLPAHAELGRILMREQRIPEAMLAFGALLDRLPLERPRLRCQSCGAHDAELRWRCAQCGEWDSFV